MPTMRPSRYAIYLVALALILFSQQIVSQIQSPPPSGTNSAATDSTKPAAKANCTNNGTYVNSKGQTVPRPENCSGRHRGHCTMSRREL
jgi:hypothetical protein